MIFDITRMDCIVYEEIKDDSIEVRITKIVLWHDCIDKDLSTQ